MKNFIIRTLICGFLSITYSLHAATDWFAYFTNDRERSNNVTPVDVTTNTVQAVIDTGLGTAEGIAITPDRSKAYVASFSGDGVAVIKLSDNSVTNIPNAVAYWGIAINSQGTRAYVVNFSDGTVDIIDLATDTFIGSIVIPTADGIAYIALTPDGKKAYVSDLNNQSVHVLDLVNNVAIGSIVVGSHPHFPAVTPDGTKVYVPNRQSETISVISTATDTVINTIAIGSSTNSSLFQVAIKPDGTKGYVTWTNTVNNNTPPGKIYIFDVATDTLDSTVIEMGEFPRGIAITPDGRTAYIANGNPSQVNSITIINLLTNTVVGTLEGPVDRAFVLAITPDQAPIASFTATVNKACHTSFFDASNSRISDLSPGNLTIAKYDWDFGDGTFVSTTSPTIEHTYTFSGTFTVKLTVTNSAGTSTTKTFTGYTVSNNGGPSATTSQTFSVSGKFPPFKLGVSICNKKKCSCTHILSWTPVKSRTVKEYRLYENGVLIKTIPAFSPSLAKEKCRSCNVTYVYRLVAVNFNNVEIQSSTVTVEGCRCPS